MVEVHKHCQFKHWVTAQSMGPLHVDKPSPKWFSHFQSIIPIEKNNFPEKKKKAVVRMTGKRWRRIQHQTVYHSQSLVDLCVTMSNKSLPLYAFKALSFFHCAFLPELISQQRINIISPHLHQISDTLSYFYHLKQAGAVHAGA